MQAVAIIVIIVIAAAGAVYYVMVMMKPSELKTAVLHLDWIPGGDMMHVYVAKELYWPDLGLDITVVRGIGSGDTAIKVGEGIADFGRAMFDAGCNVRATQLLLMKSIFNCKAASDLGFIFLRRDHGRGIIDENNLTTLEGKIFANPVWGPLTTQMQAFCELVDVDYDNIIYQHLDPGALMPALVAGEIDFTACGRGFVEHNTAFVEEALPGVEYHVVFLGDSGFEMVSDSFWVREKLIEEDPDMVAAFVEGLQKGWKYTCENLDEAGEIFVTHLPEWEGSEDTAKADFIGSFEYLADMDVILANGIGYQPPEIIEDSVYNTYAIYGIEEDLYLPNWEDVYTNEFIDPDIVPESWPWQE
jgi:NitT/TauT family transport system substrate-binding protein